jgi:Peptidase family M48
MRLFTGRPSVVGAALVPIAALVISCVNAAEGTPASLPTTRPLQEIVRDLKARLDISVAVLVSIVPNNAQLMSIEASEHASSFQLEIDATFLARLTDEELEAAIAHELGHVWLFTHHPYLQTEQLANQIAMRAVTRTALERVYAKVWRDNYTNSGNPHVLGPEPKAEGLDK